MDPKRIVCLSAEAADWFWRIGAWQQVVGVTAFFTLPPGAAPKPRVSGFSTARLDEISALEPDLIVTFSDVQASLADELIRQGFPVLATNQRSLEEIEVTLLLLSRVAGREAEGQKCLSEWRSRLTPVEPTSFQPRVYFEEWNDPLIAGIGWVGELIERAGGTDVCAQLHNKRSAADRVVTPEEIRHAMPDIILASWCGRPVQCAEIAARPGWDDLPAVKNNRIHEIPGDEILQPGFRLVHGYERIKALLKASPPT